MSSGKQMQESSSRDMGKLKFRFSDIMPSSWVYKLKVISRRKIYIQASSPSPTANKASSPRKVHGPLLHPQALSPLCPHPSPITKRRRRRKKLKFSSSAVKSHVSLTSSRNHPTSIIPEPSDSQLSPVTSSSDCFLPSPSEGYEAACVVSESVSLTKYVESKEDSPVSPVEEEPSGIMRRKQKPSNAGRKSKAANSSGIKIRVKSSKMSRKKAWSCSRERKSRGPQEKEIAESFAIVLSSVDPERDFRESMVEMIVENNMKEQKDLEDLLACYLSLNSSEYHDVIIKAFERTWLHLTNSTHPKCSFSSV